jgi:cytochrome b561
MYDASSYRYPMAVRWIHWLSVALIAIAYITAEAAEDFGEGGGTGASWHVLAGLGLLLLFVPRLLARIGVRRPPPVQARAAEKLMARAVHLALLLFVVMQPVLGILMVWAEGDALIVPMTSWQVPPLLAVGRGAEETLEELHETLGNVFYGVIGVHVLAALWHQFVRRDGILRRMW